MSRQHASLKWSGSGFALVDLQSTNGTYVNGGKATSIRLLDGDRIRIGPHDLQYVVNTAGANAMPEPDDTLIFERGGSSAGPKKPGIGRWPEKSGPSNATTTRRETR